MINRPTWFAGKAANGDVFANYGNDFDVPEVETHTTVPDPSAGCMQEAPTSEIPTGCHIDATEVAEHVVRLLRTNGDQSRLVGWMKALPLEKTHALAKRSEEESADSVLLRVCCAT